MKRLLIALQFLTIVPIKISKTVNNQDIGASLRYFPVIGILIGSTLGLVSLLNCVLPEEIVAVLIVLVLVVITGGIHLDGLADSCDGLYGIRTKEERLRIMKDSCAGAMGVIGIVLSLILRSAIIAKIGVYDLWRILIVMAVCGRWAQVFACSISSYARENGTAKNFVSYVGKTEIIFATVITLLVVFVLTGNVGIIMFSIQALCVYFLVRFCKSKIDGVTGDTIGAANEIAEICILLSGVIYAGAFYVR